MQDLTITLVQPDVTWEDKDANLAHLDELLADLPETDLVILTEMFSTGFSMKTKELSEDMDGPTMQWMAQKAKDIDAVVTGSIIIHDSGSYYNRLIWMTPDGSYQKYDKRHTFRMGDEHNNYSEGRERLVVKLNEWNICPQICYDLRFPVWNRNRNDYECLIFVANWPERRNVPWKVLLQARAIENQSYVVGVNRIGNDGHQIYHSGDSSVIDPKGEILFHRSEEECVHTMKLSAESLKFREKFPVYKDADIFTIKDSDTNDDQ